MKPTLDAPRSAGSPPLPLPGWLAAWSGIWAMNWRSVWSTRRWPMLGLVVVGGPVLAWLALRNVEVDLREEWLTWVATFHFGLVVPLWCLIAFGSLVRDEVQAGTIGFLLTRPLTRTRFFALRWLAVLVTVQGPLGLNTILLGVAALALGVPGAMLLTLLLLGALLLVVPAYGAIAACLGLLTRKYLLVGLVYGFVVEVGIGQIPTNINTLSVARHFRTLLAQSELIEQHGGWSAGQLLGSLGGLLLLTLIYLGASLLLFNVREYSQSEENKQ
ncbi:MAG: ABC transporter permease [Verrucomicrobia bacterium]|nr:ABC transporter permease [Verrucomicrobiota bacterium]